MLKPATSPPESAVMPRRLAKNRNLSQSTVDAAAWLISLGLLKSFATKKYLDDSKPGDILAIANKQSPLAKPDSGPIIKPVETKGEAAEVLAE